MHVCMCTHVCACMCVCVYMHVTCRCASTCNNSTEVGWGGGEKEPWFERSMCSRSKQVTRISIYRLCIQTFKAIFGT